MGVGEPYSANCLLCEDALSKSFHVISVRVNLNLCNYLLLINATQSCIALEYYHLPVDIITYINKSILVNSYTPKTITLGWK